MKQSAVHEVVTSELESIRLEGFTGISLPGPPRARPPW